MSVYLFEFVDHSCVKITVIDKDGHEAYGTGFFFQYTLSKESSTTVIVTNAHVVKEGKTATFKITTVNPSGGPNFHDIIDINISDLQTWVTYHPDKDIDLCIIPASIIIAEMAKIGKKACFAPYREPDLPDYAEIHIYKPTEDIYMAGYPNGLADEVHNLPLIRKGITATPFYIDHNGNPEFMVDCACFPGSSGSPISIVNESFYALHKQPIQSGNRLKLLGILYAGPMYDAKGEVRKQNVPTENTVVTDIPMNLGYCIQSRKLLDFKEQLIAEILKPKT